jgi:hypothetical protein
MAEDWNRFADSGGGMPKSDIPPFNIYSTKKGLWNEEVEARARHGSLTDRALGAVFMSARLAKKEVFFVGNGARERFNLTPAQLCRGLDRLQQRGAIKTVSTKKGKYRRIQLCLHHQDE